MRGGLMPAEDEDRPQRGRLEEGNFQKPWLTENITEPAQKAAALFSYSKMYSQYKGIRRLTSLTIADKAFEIISPFVASDQEETIKSEWTGHWMALESSYELFLLGRAGVIRDNTPTPIENSEAPTRGPAPKLTKKISNYARQSTAALGHSAMAVTKKVMHSTPKIPLENVKDGNEQLKNKVAAIEANFNDKMGNLPNAKLSDEERNTLAQLQTRHAQLKADIQKHDAKVEKVKKDAEQKDQKQNAKDENVKNANTGLKDPEAYKRALSNHQKILSRRLDDFEFRLNNTFPAKDNLQRLKNLNANHAILMKKQAFTIASQNFMIDKLEGTLKELNPSAEKKSFISKRENVIAEFNSLQQKVEQLTKLSSELPSISTIDGKEEVVGDHQEVEAKLSEIKKLQDEIFTKQNQLYKNQTTLEHASGHLLAIQNKPLPNILPALSVGHFLNPFNYLHMVNAMIGVGTMGLLLGVNKVFPGIDEKATGINKLLNRTGVVLGTIVFTLAKAPANLIILVTKPIANIPQIPPIKAVTTFIGNLASKIASAFSKSATVPEKEPLIKQEANTDAAFQKESESPQTSPRMERSSSTSFDNASALNSSSTSLNGLDASSSLDSPSSEPSSPSSSPRSSATLTFLHLNEGRVSESIASLSNPTRTQAVEEADSTSSHSHTTENKYPPSIEMASELSSEMKLETILEGEPKPPRDESEISGMDSPSTTTTLSR